VEDSRDNQALVQAYIRDSDIALEIANNGREACEKLRAERYDLVLMDMQMPVMDGYSATKAIRGWEAETLVQKTPIVALTAHALTEEIRKSLDAGCDGHLAKPVRKRQLLDTIVSWTQAGQSTRG
jgi:CheY-like chemotaxis protein